MSSDVIFVDPQARRLHRQTKGLLDGMQQMSRQARFYANYRRNIMDKTMTQGQDHVVESLENFIPEEVADNAEEVVELVLAKISNVKRKLRRRIPSRIDEIWTVMQFPVVSKLTLKLHCDVRYYVILFLSLSNLYCIRLTASYLLENPFAIKINNTMYQLTLQKK